MAHYYLYVDCKTSGCKARVWLSHLEMPDVPNIIVDYPVWFDVSIFGDIAAQNVAQQFKKGDLVYCAGSVSLHSYTAQGSTEKRTTLRLNAMDARVLALSNRADITESE